MSSRTHYYGPQTKLNLAERYYIASFLKQYSEFRPYLYNLHGGFFSANIAKMLKRSSRTIAEELKRNSVAGKYGPRRAQVYAERRRVRKKS